MSRKALAALIFCFLLTRVSDAQQTNTTGRVTLGTLASRPACPSGGVQTGDEYTATDQIPVQKYICNSSTGWLSTSASGAILPNTTLSFSATPNFPVGTNVSYTMTLTGNVTSSTTSGTPQNGALMSLTLVEDATGGRTFAFPANYVLPVGYSFDTAANHTNALTFKYDGTNWNLISLVGGGSGTPNGVNGDVQMKNGSSFVASSINDNGSLVSVTRDTQFKGPNPYVDVRAYGVRAVTSTPTTTGSITTGTNTLTVANATGFQVGDGIKVVGASVANTLSTPAAPTVTAVNANGPLKTGRVIANATGATTYQYQIVARAAGGAYTPASAVTSIANGAATLGAQSNSITNWSQSATTVTVNLTAPHNLVTGAYIYVTGDRLLAGYHKVTVTGASQFTYIDSTSQTVAATTSSATVRYFTGNHITWAAVTNTWTYCIYGRTAGSMALIGVSLPENNDSRVVGDPLYNTFDDWGSSISTATDLVCPSTPPGAAKNFDVVSTITNIAGNVFTLSNNASNTVAGATVIFDNAPNIVAAMNAATANKTAQAGVIYFPPTVPLSASYVVNSFLNMDVGPSKLSVLQAGQITVNDSILWNVGTMWSGFPKLGNNMASFQYEPYVRLNISSPIGIWHFGMISVDHVNINGTGTNQTLMLYDPNGGVAQSRLERVTFSSGGNDCTGTHYLSRMAITGGGADSFQFMDMLPGGCSSATTAPLWLRTREGGTYDFYRIFMHLRGIVFGGGTQAIFNFIYEQAATNQPKITLLSSAAFGNDLVHTVEIKNSIEDTTAEPVVSYVDTSGQSSIHYSFSFAGASEPLIQGDGNAFVRYTGLNPTYTFRQTLGAEINGVRVQGIDGLNVNQPATIPGLTQNYQHIAVGPTFAVFANGGVMAAPTCTATSGGGPPADTYTIRVAPVYAGGGEGFISNPSNSCTTSAGNLTLTITFTPISGAIGYNFYRAASSSPSNYVQMSCSVPALAGGLSTTYVFSSGAFCGASSPNPSFAGGGPTELRSAGLDTAQVTFVNGFKSTWTANAITANRTVAVPDASGQIMLSSAGATFGPLHSVATDASGLVSDWNVAPGGLVYDSFVRANGTIMAGNVNWVTVPGTSNINVSGNTITASAAGYNIAAYSGISFTADDQTARVRVTNIGGAGNFFGWVVARASTSANTWYGCGANRNTNVFELRKLVSGSATTIISVAYTAAVNDVWAIRANGTTITCTINGVQPFASQTDVSIGVGGYPGVGFFGNNGLSTSDFAASFGGVSLNAAQTWNAVQTAGASGGFDANAATALATGLRMPNAAGAASTTAGALSYDTTNKNVHVGANGVDNLVDVHPATVTPANNDCSKWTVSAGVVTHNTTGLPCSGTVFAGTATLGTSAIASGTCATVVTVAATGVLTTDTIQATFNSDPTVITGYGPSASGSLYISTYPTANNINVNVCNNTSGSITPGAATLNVKVVR